MNRGPQPRPNDIVVIVSATWQVLLPSGVIIMEFIMVMDWLIDDTGRIRDCRTIESRYTDTQTPKIIQIGSWVSERPDKKREQFLVTGEHLPK